ncbi:hypothetical protein [Algisphaera agarilytica]|uniref:Uncharacterized protein n=1 Tax=Algisphaera agarilytica TaxID=1385975 RepID=A0A7X0H4M6_9BACT|nr:hypothetical protein [Algisphaera agarilytica]MBB6429191.1 hypothetical protein [Algisphaera agarilytica]
MADATLGYGRVMDLWTLLTESQDLLHTLLEVVLGAALAVWVVDSVIKKRHADDNFSTPSGQVSGYNGSQSNKPLLKKSLKKKNRKQEAPDEKTPEPYPQADHRYSPDGVWPPQKNKVLVHGP